jgi:hypothetical protein
MSLGLMSLASFCTGMPVRRQFLDMLLPLALINVFTGVMTWLTPLDPGDYMQCIVTLALTMVVFLQERTEEHAVREHVQ